MSAATAFTLRPLERNTPDTALEGAFRVHLSMKDLKALKLSSGDSIRLSTADGSKGFAVAWLANQTNPGNKPIAKVTDLLRDKYQLSLNDRIFVEKFDQEWGVVRTIELASADHNPEALNKLGSSEELDYWVRNALVDLDVLYPACTFDVQQKGSRARQKSTKTPFIITSIEPPPDQNRPYYFDLLKSQIKLIGEVSTKKEDPQKRSEILPLKIAGIGGLTSQIATINESLDFLNDPDLNVEDQHLSGPTAVLVHGPEGTGKSLLLRRISECGWREVISLDATLITKNHGKEITDAFDKARVNEPSLILMDDLDKLLAKADSLVARLKGELEQLEGTKVVVAAAARSLYDIDASLRTTSAFNVELELLPPNVTQREDILRNIIGSDRPVSTIDYRSLAERTHGFVGRDLHKLCGLARKHRIRSLRHNLQAGASFRETARDQDFLIQEDFDAVSDQVQPTVLKDSILEVPKVRWTDIAGLDHVQELLEAIMIRPLKVPDLDIKFGGPQNRKGVLLYGPPGCAKTLIAQAIATESNQNFLAVKGSELIKMYVGESERAIRDVFRRARAAKPCIIFFDEIDSIGKSREKSQDSGLNVVATLLNEMDGIEALKEVFIIGATNRPDILDSALIRTGRFDAHIHIGLPNEDARRQIFQIHTRKRPLADDVDLSILAAKTDGSSGADIKGLCSVAVEMAISDYTKAQENDVNVRPQIAMNHFEKALEKHIPHTVKEEAARYENWRPGKSLSDD